MTISLFSCGKSQEQKEWEKACELGAQHHATQEHLTGYQVYTYTDPKTGEIQYCRGPKLVDTSGFPQLQLITKP